MNMNYKKVLIYWFGEQLPCIKPNYKLWFSKIESQDQEIKSTFEPIYKDLCINPLQLGENSEELLASIIILDQFSRNMYRGQPSSFEQDFNARSLAYKFLSASTISDLIGPYELMFAYMPFMHSEDLSEQERCLNLFFSLAEKYPELKGAHKYAQDHYEIIKKFGRFPHRNEILNRVSTPEEVEFLKEPGSSF